MYHNGEGVNQDNDEAIRCFREAAAQAHEGAKEALRRLGLE